jgi:hypothetical protein
VKRTLSALNARNARVEADKAWETSKTRRAIIAIVTYALVVIFLYLIRAPQPWLTAIVPALGYVLSTLAIVPLKQWWLRNVYK